MSLKHIKEDAVPTVNERVRVANLALARACLASIADAEDSKRLAYYASSHSNQEGNRVLHVEHIEIAYYTKAGE